MAAGKTDKVTNDSSAGSGSGYCKMPDGTLIQWGAATVASGSFTGSFSLPVSLYRIQDSSVVLTPLQTGTDFNVNYADSSNSEIKFGRTPNTLASTYYWMVFGRWKA